MSKDLLVQLCGLHSFGFAAFHLAFWKLFDWKRDLQRVSFATRAVTQILNLRLIYVFLGIGVLCFAFTRELHETPLGRAVLVFMSLFWVGRTIEQFVFLRINKALVHALTALFVLGAALFAAPLFV
jgi:hypothetical protein